MSKLFIYIPTFNRPEALRLQLTILIPQVVKFSSDVRLIVNDNASTVIDESIKLMLNGYSNIEYRVNCGNIEANANIALGFVFSKRGEFVWILSDNDIITQSAVEYILKNLDSSIDFFCFNYAVREVAEFEHDWKDGWEKPMDWRFGLISDGLYNSETIKDSIASLFYFHNTSFPHLALSCASAKKKGSVKFKLLPREQLINSFYSSDECPTDYTIAQVGFPLILPLFPENKAKKFARSWIIKHGLDFYIHRKKRYFLYLQSKTTLSYYGGMSARGLLFFMRVFSIVGIPYVNTRQFFICFLKKKLSVSTIEKLKNIRRLMWEK